MNSPRLSIVLAALDDYAIIEQVHLCIEAQTIRPHLELVIVCRSEQALRLPQGFRDAHPDVVLIEGGDEILLNEARALGVRRASADYVLILEDHCLPHADCVERMLERLEEGWSVVGPAFVGGNTVFPIGIAANLLTYGQWMGVRQGGPRSFVSGYNSAFPRAVLLARGDRLSDDLITPSVLQMSLAAEGHRFYFEPRAVVVHWESSTWSGVWRILTKNGRALGMLRARRWSLPGRILASVANPLLTAHRCLRGMAAFGRTRERSMVVLLLLAPLSAIWTLGELSGYWCRDPRSAVEGISDVERNRQRFVDPREAIRRRG